MIRPSEVSEKVKTVLRNASGIVSAINELRDNHSLAHPNSILIQEREAMLVIRLINAVVDYIEELEEEYYSD